MLTCQLQQMLLPLSSTQQFRQMSSSSSNCECPSRCGLIVWGLEASDSFFCVCMCVLSGLGVGLNQDLCVCVYVCICVCVHALLSIYVQATTDFATLSHLCVCEHQSIHLSVFAWISPLWKILTHTGCVPAAKLVQGRWWTLKLLLSVIFYFPICTYQPRPWGQSAMPLISSRLALHHSSITPLCLFRESWRSHDCSPCSEWALLSNLDGSSFRYCWISKNVKE